MRMIYIGLMALILQSGRSRNESRELATVEISRTLDARPPDFIRLKRLLQIGAILGVILGFGIFVIGVILRLIIGSMGPLNAAFALGAFPWAVGAVQWLRWLMVPIQERAWRGREAPLPWILRPTWLDLIVGLATSILFTSAMVKG